MEIKGKELFLKRIGNYKSLFFIDSVKLAQISVFLFFSYDFLQTGLNWVLGASRFSTFLCLLIIYTPVFIGIILYPKKFIKFDFILLLSFVICFFLLSLLFHPDYDYFYLRSGYGVWDHVLIPYRGIYAYYFVRLLSDQPIKLTMSIKAAGLAMMMYFIYSIYAAHMRGYWLGVVGDNGAAHLTYSVEFGYKVLPFCILFLNEGFKKKWFWLILGVVTSGMVFLYGSRGPALFIILFVFIYFIIRFLNSNKKIKHLKILFPLLIIMILFSEDILIVVNDFLNCLGVSSRFLSNLLSGSFFNGNGRITLWTQAIELIKENPLGYGAMGSREALSDIIVAGYPHNVILEILLDFGVIFGCFLILFFVVYTIKILFVDRKNEWTDLYLVYFSTACGLMISLTFWSTSSFWICLAIIISYVFKTKNNGNEIEERIF